MWRTQRVCLGGGLRGPWFEHACGLCSRRRRGTLRLAVSWRAAHGVLDTFSDASQSPLHHPVMPACLPPSLPPSHLQVHWTLWPGPPMSSPPGSSCSTAQSEAGRSTVTGCGATPPIAGGPATSRRGGSGGAWAGAGAGGTWSADGRCGRAATPSRDCRCTSARACPAGARCHWRRRRR